MAFSDIKGQAAAIKFLKGFLSAEKLDGGFLFTGPEGVGKKLTAINFAKAVNCRDSKLDCCDKCISCVKINKGLHPDMHMIDLGSSDIKVEDIRALQEEISLRPYEARKKVFIINNAHNLNFISGNAFLKTLEEPPKDSIIILVTDKPVLLLETIVSRCRRLKFYSMERQELKNILLKDYGVSQGEVHFLSYFSDGRLGNALSLKQEGVFGLKNRVIDSFINKSDFEQASLKERDEIKLGFNILMNWFRDIYLLKVGIPQEELINFDRKDMLWQYSRVYSFEKLDEILNTISESVAFLDQNVNIKLLLSNLSVSLRN